MNVEMIVEQVLKLVHAAEYKPTKPSGIHKNLKLADEDYPHLRRAIKNLVRDGKLVFGPNHFVLRPTQLAGEAYAEPMASSAGASLSQSATSSPARQAGPTTNPARQAGPTLSPDRQAGPTVPKRDKGDVTGTFRTAPSRDFGFVKLAPVAGEGKFDDVFIPPTATRGAMEGDTVRIRIVRSSKDGKVEGAVQEIMVRARREFSGTYQLVDDKSLVWLDGANLEHPIEVGDIRGLPLNNQDKVIVELVRFPDSFHVGEGVILRVLGSSKNPAVDTMAVMHQFGLPDSYPEAALEVARHQADLFDENVIPAGRTDLRLVPTLTIDPVDARDFDDAISLSKNEKGNWELQVHIADVSHFVPVGSALDDEARKRGTSVYLPDRVVPMIPETISNHLASLQPGHSRLAKTVFMEYTPDGTLIFTRTFNSVILNQHRFNYDQIDNYLEDRETWRTKLTPEIFQVVADMHELAMLLRQIRNTKGALELTLPEVKIDLDKTGKVRGAHLVLHTESHQMIEEFMLAANQAVAFWLDSLELPFLRRAHAPPNRMKMRRLNEFVRALGIQAENMEDRFEIQRVVNAVRGRPTEYAVNFAILKSMSKAVYQAEFERHYALDMTHYCHFTSPIRRYPDLVVHRIVQKLLEGKPARENEEVLEHLGQQCSDAEQNAELAERELIRVKLLHFMAKKHGELLHGVVAGVRPTGITIRAIEIPVDGLIPVKSLPNDRYRFDRDTHTLEGHKKGNRFRLGDELIVRVERIDTAKRHLIFGFEKIVHHAMPVELGHKKQKGNGEKKEREIRTKRTSSASKSEALTSRLKNRNGKKKPRK